jgi:hypothetical protein
VTRISTGSRFRGIDSIRITVDPSNQCRVEASLQFRPVAVLSRKARVTHLPPASGKCFVFAGQSYCE